MPTTVGASLQTSKVLSWPHEEGWHWGCLDCRPLDFFLCDTVHYLFFNPFESLFPFTFNQEHCNYYMQSVHLGWGSVHLNWANGSLWRRFKDKNLFPPFLPEKLYLSFKSIQDPLKCHFHQAEFFVVAFTSSVLPLLLYYSTYSFNKYLLSAYLWLGNVLGTGVMVGNEMHGDSNLVEDRKWMKKFKCDDSYKRDQKKILIKQGK